MAEGAVNVARVAICIPAYNQPERLLRTLQSVAAQSFRDYQVVVTDDSEGDAVAQAVGAFAADPRFRYVRNPTRKGSPENWNEAIRRSDAPYVKLLHHDDWFSGPDSLGEFVKLLDEHPKADFAFSASRACDAAGDLLYVHVPRPEQLRALAREPGMLFLGNFIGAPSATLFRRCGLEFDIRLKWMVDLDFYVRLLSRNPRFVSSARPLVSITARGPGKVTEECVDNAAVEVFEALYLYRKLPLGVFGRLRSLRFLMSLLRRFGISTPEDLAASGVQTELAAELRALLGLERCARWARRLVKGDPRTRPRRSYAQCGEDLIVEHLAMWLGLESPTYLDIGAHHPTWLSNTYFFYKQGCRGVLVEADPLLCKELVRKRPRDVCLNIGVGIGAAREADFFVMSARTLNTFSREEAERYSGYGADRIREVIKVPLRPVNEILAEHFPQASPSFVSLDVEGMDLAILRDFDFSRYRPEIFCIETLTFTRDDSERKLSEVIEFMQERDYRVYADTYINTIFVDRRRWDARRPKAREGGSA